MSPRLRHYGAMAYLRDIFKSSTPIVKRQRSSHQSGTRSHHRTHHSHETPAQPHYPSNTRSSNTRSSNTKSSSTRPSHSRSSTSRHYSRYEAREPAYTSSRTRKEPSYSSTRSRKAHIANLPPELKHIIVSDLDPVTSACLGLASKDYYPIHRSQHRQRISLFDQGDGRLPLAMYLREWAPKDMVLDPRSGRLIRRDREGESGRERDSEKARWERRLRRTKRWERMDVGRDVGRHRW